MFFKNKKKEDLEKWKKEKGEEIDAMFGGFNPALIDNVSHRFDSNWSELKTLSDGNKKVRFMTEYISNTEFNIHTYVKIGKITEIKIPKKDGEIPESIIIINSRIRKLIKDALEIDGVISVDTDFYSIRVKKGAIFNHEELAIRIAPLIGKYFIDQPAESKISDEPSTEKVDMDQFYMDLSGK